MLPGLLRYTIYIPCPSINTINIFCRCNVIHRLHLHCTLRRQSEVVIVVFKGIYNIFSVENIDTNEDERESHCCQSSAYKDNMQPSTHHYLSKQSQYHQQISYGNVPLHTVYFRSRLQQ